MTLAKVNSADGLKHKKLYEKGGRDTRKKAQSTRIRRKPLQLERMEKIQRLSLSGHGNIN